MSEFTRTFTPTLRQNSPTKLTTAQVDANFSGLATAANGASRSYTAVSQESMLALAPPPQGGDHCWRSDEKKDYVFLGGEAAEISNWARDQYSVDQIDGALASSDLANTSSETKGAGLVGFLESLAYAAGTVGGFLKNLGSSIGSSMIGYKASFNQTIQRTIEDKFKELVYATDWAPSGTFAENIATIQKAIDELYATGNPHTLVIPDGFLYSSDHTAADPFIYRARITIVDKSDSQSYKTIKNGQYSLGLGANNDSRLQAAQHPAFILNSLTTLYGEPSAVTKSAQINGTIVGTTLSINSLTSGEVVKGQLVLGSGVNAKTIVTAGSGTSWTVSVSQNIGPISMSLIPTKTIDTLDSQQQANCPSHPASVIWQADGIGNWQLCQDKDFSNSDHLTMYALSSTAKGYSSHQCTTWFKDGNTVYGQLNVQSWSPVSYPHVFRGNTCFEGRDTGTVGLILQAVNTGALPFSVTRRKIFTLETDDAVDVNNTANNKIIFRFSNSGLLKGASYTTTQRNALTPNSSDIGGMVYDTTLGKPIWLYDTTPTWKDAVGTTV